ncbi:hypothetical protein DFO73_11815 [Cytobacillus oceanisediminis]|jgi:hypothetical protein|uniref:Uncharacterized protein n=1 Tax=Cytobacillus oceanisediminis TaxID=665099 RepID=A0A2V2ZSD0_9BACI|nr:hypothetical protein [Cytobacillus oceanisediminis]PWW19821.1 hypothetical protein DFO73_11815 [Cytobacillus oceanisediminis]
MISKKDIIIGILSLAFTIISPFTFHSYYEGKPESTIQNIVFGAPFPFAEQTISFPENSDSYPLEVKFISPFEKETDYKVVPFLFSFFSYFLLFYSLYTIFSRYMTRKPKRKKEEQT